MADSVYDILLVCTTEENMMISSQVTTSQFVGEESKRAPFSGPKHIKMKEAKNMRIARTPFASHSVVIKTEKGLSLLNLYHYQDWVLLGATGSFSSHAIQDVFCLEDNKMIWIYQEPGKNVRLIPVQILSSNVGMVCHIQQDNQIELEGEFGWANLSASKRYLSIKQIIGSTEHYYLFSTNTLKKIDFKNHQEKQFLSSSLIGIFSETSSAIMEVYRLEEIQSLGSAAKQLGVIELPFCSFRSQIKVSPNGQWVAWISITAAGLFLNVYPLVPHLALRKDINTQTQIELFHTLEQELIWLEDSSLLFLGDHHHAHGVVQRFHPVSRKTETICMEPADGFSLINHNVLIYFNDPAKISIYPGVAVHDNIIQRLMMITSLALMPPGLVPLIASYIENKSSMESAIERVCYVNGKSLHFDKLPRASRRERVYISARGIPLFGRLFLSPTSFEIKKSKYDRAMKLKPTLISAIENKPSVMKYADCINTLLSQHHLVQADCPIHLQSMIKNLIRMDEECVENRFTV